MVASPAATAAGTISMSPPPISRNGVKSIKKDSKRARLNDDITSPEVRLVASDGSQVGVVSLTVALETAQKETLDLVEISPDAEPPVCKIMDYGKHVFDIKKKVALQKEKAKADSSKGNEVSTWN